MFLIVQYGAGLLGKVTPELEPTIELPMAMPALGHATFGVLPILFTANLLFSSAAGFAGTNICMLFTNMYTHGMGCGEVLTTLRASTTKVGNRRDLPQSNSLRRRLRLISRRGDGKSALQQGPPVLHLLGLQMTEGLGTNGNTALACLGKCSHGVRYLQAGKKLSCGLM